MKNILFKNQDFQYNEKKGETKYYRCSSYLKTNCCARIIKRGTEFAQTNEHTCSKNTARKGKLNSGMAIKIGENAAANTVMTSNQIYHKMLDEVSKKSETIAIKLPFKRKVGSIVKELRDYSTFDISSTES